MKGHDALLVVPALRAERGPGGSFVLTQKFLEGVATYCKYWPGPVVVAIQRIDRVMDNLDHVAVHPDSQPFSLRWLDTAEDSVSKLIGEARFVLSSLVPQHERMARLCADAGVPMAFVTEYSLRTRQQIIRAETRNPLRRWRRLWYEAGRERRNLEAVRLATGLQCNGTPTFEAYRSINPAALLFFDNRVRADMVAAPQTVEARTKQMKKRRTVAAGLLRSSHGHEGRAPLAQGRGGATATGGRLHAGHLRRWRAGGADEAADRAIGTGRSGPTARRARLRERAAAAPGPRGRSLRGLPPAGRSVLHVSGDDVLRRSDRGVRQRSVRGHGQNARRGLDHAARRTGPAGPAHRGTQCRPRRAHRGGARFPHRCGRAIVRAHDEARVDHMLACCDAAPVEVGAA